MFAGRGTYIAAHSFAYRAKFHPEFLAWLEDIPQDIDHVIFHV